MVVSVFHLKVEYHHQPKIHQLQECWCCSLELLFVAMESNPPPGMPEASHFPHVVMCSRFYVIGPLWYNGHCRLQS